MAETKIGADVKFAFYTALVLCVVGAVIDNGAIGYLLAPLVLGLAFYAMARAPLRASLLVLTFLAFTQENPSELFASGNWKSPLAPFGRLLLMHLKETIGGGIFFSGMDIMLMYLGLVVLFRHLTGSSIDRVGAVPTPRPLLRLAHLSLVATVLVYLHGKMRGGNMSMALWQVDRVFYLPVVFLLYSAGLRGPKDLVALGKVVLAAGVYRAAMAVYVQYEHKGPIDPYTGAEAKLPYATTHNDSMLFAFASVVVGAIFLQRLGGKARGWALAALPVLILGMIENGRRMVWVQIIIVFAVMYVVTPMNAVKRKLQKGLLYASPIIIGYVAIGWNASHKIFKPVKTIRSAVDSDTDSSTQWRDIENLNLVFTWRDNMVLGTGYGHGFYEIIPLPEVGHILERYIPHNSILGLWTYCGLIGYTAISSLWVAGVYFALRAYHASKVPTEKAGTLVAFGAVPIYFLQCYGDMGLGSWTGVFMMAPALAVAGKVAVATGAWSASPGKRPKSPNPAPEDPARARPKTAPVA